MNEYIFCDPFHVKFIIILITIIFFNFFILYRLFVLFKLTVCLIVALNT